MGVATGGVAVVAGCLGGDAAEDPTGVDDRPTDTIGNPTGAAAQSTDTAGNPVHTGENPTETAGQLADAPERTTDTPAQSTGIPTVDLGAAENYSILAKSGISTVPDSAVTGDIGVSPIASTALTGFSLTMDASGEFSSSEQVGGRVVAADYAAPTPAKLTTAVADMEAAYTDVAGRSDPDVTDLGGGDISGMTLAPGLYKWGTGVVINEDITLEGRSGDAWIFQIAGELTTASDTSVVLSGGAEVKNIVWQVAERAVLGTGAQFAGIILTQTGMDVRTGASVNGSVYAQTDVTLEQASVTG